MPTCHERARAVLSRVDPARQWSGWPVGLRDGALVALLAAGLTAREISRLRASAITMNRGTLLITVHRHGVNWHADLPADLGGRLLVWLAERRLWAEGTHVFTSPQEDGPLDPKAIHAILDRYRGRRRARRC